VGKNVAFVNATSRWCIYQALRFVLQGHAEWLTGNLSTKGKVQWNVKLTGLIHLSINATERRPKYRSLAYRTFPWSSRPSSRILILSSTHLRQEFLSLYCSLHHSDAQNTSSRTNQTSSGHFSYSNLSFLTQGAEQLV
jgi:hypothetical protein